MKDGKYIATHPEIKFSLTVVVKGNTVTYKDGTTGGLEDLTNWTLIPDESDEFVPPPLESLTCYKCDQRKECAFVDDPYNTNGDCLAMK